MKACMTWEAEREKVLDERELVARPSVIVACNVSIRQHTSAYVSIRQHTSAYVSIRQHTSAYVSIRLTRGLAVRHSRL
jgi:hypothetical protein